jgi:hypothetical protein
MPTPSHVFPLEHEAVDMQPLQSFYDLIDVPVEADRGTIDSRTRELLDMLEQATPWARFLAILRGRGPAQMRGVRDILLDSERRREYDERWEEVTRPGLPGFPWL